MINNLNKEFYINKLIDDSKEVKFGSRIKHAYTDDPKHILFNLSRYKFVSKMFNDYNNVLEIGCGDAFGTALVLQNVKSITATDIDDIFIKHNIENHFYANSIKFEQKDFIKNHYDRIYDAAYLLDVLEHIEKKDENIFIKNICKSLKSDGDLIIGIPSLTSQKYASDISKLGHVNCKNAEDLKFLMLNYFNKVFIFSMNDEVVHTGFYPMSHYYFALCVSKK